MVAAACGAPAAVRRLASPKRHRTAAVADATVDGLPVADWLVEENRRPGTVEWVIRTPPNLAIEGYTDKVSVTAGEELALHVSTAAPRFRAEVYRMGFYQGQGARHIETVEATGGLQPAPGFTPGLNMIECAWTPSLRLQIDGRYPPGNYLVKLIGSGGQVRYVPFLVRDDASKAAFAVQSSVTTWQAYNLWSGYSLYGGTPLGDLDDYESRSRVVSFDRPYGHPPLDAHGSGDWLGNEFPFIYLAERHGLDVTYWTDVDLHLRPGLLRNHRALVSLGHDEYWSWEMRAGVEDALAHGTNLAVLGANCCYRQIRFEASPTGENRRVICYKDASEDPITATRPELATAISWALGPVPMPESEFLGTMYQSYGGKGPLLVADAASFVFAGTGLRNGDHIPGIVGSEFDGFEPGLSGPRNVEILGHSPTTSVSGRLYSDMTYYTRAGAGGVFTTGTAAWVTSLWNGVGGLPRLLDFGIARAMAPATAVTLNVLREFARGPAGVHRPSVANWQRFYATDAPVNLGRDV